MTIQPFDTDLNSGSLTEPGSTNGKSNTNLTETERVQQSDAVTARIDSKESLNAAILQANHDVSIASKNDPLALIYKTAIDAINKELETDYGENSIQKGYESGLDVSPEATAGRILSFSTGLFSLYQEQHPEMDEGEQVESFVDIIGGGIETGFSEAKEILEGLGVMEGKIAEDISTTYDLVLQGLEAFKAQFDSSPATGN